MRKPLPYSGRPAPHLARDVTLSGIKVRINKQAAPEAAPAVVMNAAPEAAPAVVMNAAPEAAPAVAMNDESDKDKGDKGKRPAPVTEDEADKELFDNMSQHEKDTIVRHLV